jgi:hypothetical protein
MPGKRWDNHEIQSLRKQWEKSSDIAKIKIRGRTHNSVKRKLIRQGLLDSTLPPREPWNRKEELLLKDLVVEGKTAQEIYELGHLGRSKDSIAQKISRMRLLVGKKRSQMLRECRRLYGTELNDFLTAVKDFGESRHTQWFVWKYAVGRGKVKRALAESGRMVTWKDAMQMPQTRTRFVSRVSEASALAWVRRRDVLRDQLVSRLHEIDTEIGLNPNLKKRSNYERRICETCYGSWYASEEFFKPSVKRLPDGRRKVYLQRSCRICTSGARGTTSKDRRNEQLIRKRWNESLTKFEYILRNSHPELFSEQKEGEVMRWEPFVEMLSEMAAPNLTSLASSIISIYSKSEVNEVLDRIERTCFDGEPELHVDVWELDEMTRAPGEQRMQYVRQNKLLSSGKELAIRLYRVIRLPAYARSLI